MINYTAVCNLKCINFFLLRIRKKLTTYIIKLGLCSHIRKEAPSEWLGLRLLNPPMGEKCKKLKVFSIYLHYYVIENTIYIE